MVSILDHISQEELNDLSDAHYDHILAPTKAEHLVLSELEYIRDDVKYTALQRQITSYILGDFVNLIKGKPDQLEEKIAYFDNHGYNREIARCKTFRTAILEAFGYSKFRGWVAAVDLAQGLDLKSCPYCNAQYTIITKAKGSNKLLFQLDHFYPKVLYPYLSMSFYNLIPSCGSCNISKSKNDTRIADSYHPYVTESISDDFYFCTDNLDVVEAYIKGKTKFSIKIKDESTLPNKTKKHLKDYSIKKLFERHGDIVEEIVWKKFIYSKKNRDQLWRDYNTRLFADRYDFERFIVGNYTQKKDTHKRPLSKFATDIARDLGLINGNE